MWLWGGRHWADAGDDVRQDDSSLQAGHCGGADEHGGHGLAVTEREHNANSEAGIGYYTGAAEHDEAETQMQPGTRADRQVNAGAKRVDEEPGADAITNNICSSDTQLVRLCQS